MTKEEIQKHAQELKENFGDASLFVGGWVEGATWANEQNAARIAELEAALAKWIEAYETQWPIGSKPVYEATKDVITHG